MHNYTFGYQIIDRQQCEGDMDDDFLRRPLLGRIVGEHYVPKRRLQVHAVRWWSPSPASTPRPGNGIYWNISAQNYRLPNQ